MSNTRRLAIAPVLDPALTTAKDQRIREIALRMAAGDWHPYRGPLDVARQTGLSPHTVADYAKEAARLLRLSWADDQARVALLERIQTLGEEARSRTEEVLDKDGRVQTLRKPDMKSAIRATEIVANILGLTKQQHDVRVSYEAMTDEQLMAETTKFLERKNDRNPEGAPQQVVQITEQEDDREERSAAEGDHVHDAVLADDDPGR